MNETLALPVHKTDSVGSRVHWGAVIAGSVLTLGICLLLTSLSAATGLSLNAGQFNATTIPMGVIVWLVVISCVALFVGGMTTSLLTTGETKTEAAIYGILTWAVVLGFSAFLGSLGVTAGMNAIAPHEMNAYRSAVTRPAEPGVEQSQNLGDREQIRQKLAWYSFGGIWLSMIAATAGAVIGAGPTFRRQSVVIVPLNG